MPLKSFIRLATLTEPAGESSSLSAKNYARKLYQKYTVYTINNHKNCCQ